MVLIGHLKRRSGPVAPQSAQLGWPIVYDFSAAVSASTSQVSLRGALPEAVEFHFFPAEISLMWVGGWAGRRYLGPQTPPPPPGSESKGLIPVKGVAVARQLNTHAVSMRPRYQCLTRTPRSACSAASGRPPPTPLRLLPGAARRHAVKTEPLLWACWPRRAVWRARSARRAFTSNPKQVHAAPGRGAGHRHLRTARLPRSPAE